MNSKQEEILKKAHQLIRSLFEGEGTGHDWWHILRVVNMSKKLQSMTPEADAFVVELTALMHDVGDHKFHNGETEHAALLIQKYLEELEVEQEIIDQIITTVEGLSYKGANVDSSLTTIEGQIVQDADRIDAIGAIGVARTFAYGGNKNREIYNPEIQPEMHDSFDAYKKSTAPTINHFYEKLLLLKDRMNTEAAKEIAEERHVFMQQYLDQFYAEWEGEK